MKKKRYKWFHHIKNWQHEANEPDFFVYTPGLQPLDHAALYQFPMPTKPFVNLNHRKKEPLSSS